jgi:hypothetical protein
MVAKIIGIGFEVLDFMRNGDIYPGRGRGL